MIFTKLKLKSLAYEFLKFIGVCCLFWIFFRYALRIQCDFYYEITNLFNPSHYNTNANVFEQALQIHTMPRCPNTLQAIINYLLIAIIFFVFSFKNKISSSWYKEWIMMPLLVVLFLALIHFDEIHYLFEGIRGLYTVSFSVFLLFSLLLAVKKSLRGICLSIFKWSLIILLLTAGLDWYFHNRHNRYEFSDYPIHEDCMNTNQIESTENISIDKIQGYNFYDFSDITINGNNLSFKFKGETKKVNLENQEELYENPTLKAIPIWSSRNIYGEYEHFIGKSKEAIVLAVGERKSGDCSYYTSFKVLTFPLAKNDLSNTDINKINSRKELEEKAKNKNETQSHEQDTVSESQMEKDGKYYPCDDADNDFTETECNKCPEFRKFKNGRCIFTKSPYPDRPLMSSTAIGYKDRQVQHGTSFDACDYKGTIKTTPENCSLCPNRRYEDGACFLNECPEGYFSGYQGRCYKCSDTGAGFFYTTTKENCYKCPERELKDGSCILRVCPKDSPVRKDGRCLPCDWGFEIEPGQEDEIECLKCPNLKYENGKCVRKEKDKESIKDNIKEPKIEQVGNINETSQNTQIFVSNAKSEKDIRIFYVENPIQAKKLLEKGAEINSKNDDGESVLTNAIKKGYNFDLIQFYIDNGADISFKNATGKDAFILAYENGFNLELMDLLIKKGAVVEENYLKAYKMIKDCSEDPDWYMEYTENGQPKACRPCSEEKSLGFTTEKDCSKCPNHVRLKNAKFIDQCLSCDNDFTFLSSWDNGDFHNICKKWIPDEQTGYYKLPQCPNETPIWGKGKNSATPECFKCDYYYQTNPYGGGKETVIRTSKSECDKCPLREFYYGDVFYHGNAINRNYAGLEKKNIPYEGICVASNTQQSYFEVEGKKYHCRGFQPIQTTEENCKKCGEWRRMENGMCILAKFDSTWKEEEVKAGALITYTSDLSKNLDISVIQSFISKGEDINLRQPSTGMTPLMYAVQHVSEFKEKDVAVINKMIDLGADINAQDNEGNTPLIWCLRNACHRDSIKILLSKGANVNQGNKEGKTALFWAVQDDDLQTVKLLVSSGADPLQKNKQGINAVERAQRNPSRFVKEYLNDYVAKGQTK